MLIFSPNKKNPNIYMNIKCKQTRMGYPIVKSIEFNAKNHSSGAIRKSINADTNKGEVNNNLEQLIIDCKENMFISPISFNLNFTTYDA